MDLIRACPTHQNIKEPRNMSISSKTQDWDESYSKFRRQLKVFSNSDLEVLLDAYKELSPLADMQIKAITDELAFRRTPLGQELE